MLVFYDFLVEKLIAETRLFFRVVSSSFYYLNVSTDSLLEVLMVSDPAW